MELMKKHEWMWEEKLYCNYIKGFTGGKPLLLCRCIWYQCYGEWLQMAIKYKDKKKYKVFVFLQSIIYIYR